MVEAQTTPPPRRRGRPKGVPNRVTREIKVAAQKKGPQALRHLWQLAMSTEDDKLKMQILSLVLAYAYGKPPQVDAAKVAEAFSPG